MASRPNKRLGSGWLTALIAGLGAASGAGAGTEVVSNPSFGAQPGNVDFTYKGDPSALVKQPYVEQPVQNASFGKRFANLYSGNNLGGSGGKANALNNQYALNEADNNARAVLAREGYTQQDALATKKHGFDKELKKLEIESAIAAAQQKLKDEIEAARSKQPLEVLTKENIPYNEQNLNMFQGVVPGRVQAAIAGDTQKTALSQLGAQDARQKLAIGEASQGDIFTTGIGNNKLKAMEALTAIQQQPEMSDINLANARMKTPMMQSLIDNRGVKTVSGDGTLVDLNGNPIFTSEKEDPINALVRALTEQRGGGAAAPTPLVPKKSTPQTITKSPVNPGAPSAPSAPVRKVDLGDGTVRVEYSDGSSKILKKKQPAASPAQ